MKELSDKDFDQIFKNKIKEGYPEYEEGSWLKMEKKLLKRDRFVFYRNASIILLFLSFGIGLYLISGEKLAFDEAKITFTPLKVEKSNSLSSKNNSFTETIVSIPPASRNEYVHDSFITTKKQLFSDEKAEIISKSVKPIISQTIEIDSTTRIAQNQVVPQNAQVIMAQESTNSTVNEILIDDKPNALQKTNTKKSKLPIALSINVGPDFSSTESAIGGKSGMAVGVGISVGLSRKLSLQTGANYGSKNYTAKGYDYAFNNPNTANIIEGIDAACKVLEVPLRASFTVMNNQKNSIDLNAGLSSYFMLKENYRFIYTAASGRKDRFLERKNSNQHYLSVIDLSATYNIKLKNKKFALGVQPYIKIPISGIGEGGVPLKSSGISLKLNYELKQKN